MNSNQWPNRDESAEAPSAPAPAPEAPPADQAQDGVSFVPSPEASQEPPLADAPNQAPQSHPESASFEEMLREYTRLQKRKKVSTFWKSVAAVFGAAIILGAGIFGGFWLKDRLEQNGGPQSPSKTEEAGSSNTKPVVPPDDKEPIFTPDTEKTETMNAKEIYASNVNSIVGITVEGTVVNIFGSQSAYASSGTGFVLDDRGYILTNYHVVKGKDSVTTPKITVTLYNAETYEAKVIGYDEFSDVALIKIEAEGLSPVSLGNSDKLVAGENVAIIGHPLGELTYSISKGIVAAVNREIAVENKKLEMFQIDAAVNSGNSGGPAFNEKGQVVGIVTSKYASSSIEGLGFCIPINNAVKIANDLINYGFIRGQAGLGISAKTVVTGSGYFQQNYGVQVVSVDAGSGAEKAGIRQGDIIIGIGGFRVTSMDDMNAMKANYKMGDTATITLLRDSEQIEVEVTFDEFIPEHFNQAPGVA